MAGSPPNIAAMAMKALLALQHTESEFLGLMEDHFEGRGIAFRYSRPFAAGDEVPATGAFADGLVLLGGGPWGTVSGDILPGLEREVRLTRDFLKRRKPVVALGLGAQILALAAGGHTEAAPLTFSVGHASRVRDDALNGFLPERFPHVVYMRDRPVLPDDALILAVDEHGGPAVFQVGGNSIGFIGHPGFKSAMIEDLIMEFDESPEDPLPALERVRALQEEGAEALAGIMVGLVQVTRLMQAPDEREKKQKTFIPIQQG